MNKFFLVSMLFFAFLNIQAAEENFSNSEIMIRIDKNGLVYLVEKKSLPGFIEKFFNVGGEAVCGALMGVVIGAALMLYEETVVMNNAPALQLGVAVIDKNKWNGQVVLAVVSGAALGGSYGFLNGVYKNFVKS